MLRTDNVHICVCICTFKRPDYLRRLLAALQVQETGGAFTYSVVVADNDSEQSAQPVVADFSLLATYCTEPRQNIALARNQALAHARGDFIAFIDDDEIPAPTWLRMHLEACEKHEAAGVLGPVRPHFDNPPPYWIIKGGFCNRPEYRTGTVIGWDESRTGNLLFRRRILDGIVEPFDPEFGTGGEDKDFFLRMTARGHVFIWCNEAIVYETVPPVRWKRGYMLKRALLRGKNILKLPIGRAGLLARSIAAVPLYLVALPVLLLFGQHWFMRYCIKLCDHLGRLLAVVGINPVRDR